MVVTIFLTHIVFSKFLTLGGVLKSEKKAELLFIELETKTVTDIFKKYLSFPQRKCNSGLKQHEGICK